MKNTTYENKQYNHELTQHFLRRLKERYVHLLNHKKKFEIKAQIKELIDDFGITEKDLDFKLVRNWSEAVIKLSYLKPFLELDCHEIILHNFQKIQVITPTQRSHQNLELCPEDYQLGLESLAHGNDQDWSYNTPFVSFPCQLHGHEVRVTLVHACLTRESTSKLYLRKVHHQLSNLKQLNLDEDVRSYLGKCVESKKNVLICGPTGSGKTTLLKAMLNEIPSDEHLLLMEDCAEIDLQRPLTTHLVSGPHHSEKTLESFCTYAMRLRPDRIVLGEVRGREIAPFLLAMNTGHQGLMATLHANSAIDCISRISNLFGLYSPQQYLSQENITKLVCQNIDAIIYMERREVREIICLTGCEGGQPYYRQELDLDKAS